jgi:hypothetical protein
MEFSLKKKRQEKKSSFEKEKKSSFEKEKKNK